MKDYAGTLLMVVMTTLIGIGCSSAVTHGASQRSGIDDMRRSIVSEARAIRDLEVELRTRARLPQLERWNEQVLKMSAPAAGQFMGSPVQLINLVTPPKPVAPAVPELRFALAPAEPERLGNVVQARFEIDTETAEDAKLGIVRAAYPASEPSATLNERLDASLREPLVQPQDQP